MRIYAELEREELRFVSTLEKGEALLDELLTKAASSGAQKVRTGSMRSCFAPASS